MGEGADEGEEGAENGEAAGARYRNGTTAGPAVRPSGASGGQDPGDQAEGDEGNEEAEQEQGEVAVQRIDAEEGRKGEHPPVRVSSSARTESHELLSPSLRENQQEGWMEENSRRREKPSDTRQVRRWEDGLYRERKFYAGFLRRSSPPIS